MPQAAIRSTTPAAALNPAQNGKKATTIPRPDFIFRGGCALVVDLNTSQVRYSVYKDVNSDGRLARQRAFESGQTGNASSGLRATYFSGQLRHAPFALLHRSGQEEEIEWLA